MELPIEVKAESVKEAYPEIFNWTDYLNLNLYIVISMMLIVAIINMASTILVIILEKKNSIGILKTLGAKNFSISKIFVTQAGMIILKAMVVGNLIGVGLLLLQDNFEIIPLNPEVYFVNTVPVSYEITSWIFLNIFTFTVCTISMLLPAAVISRFKPGDVLRFR
jgi:lipoprotein-releasing system permease protein